MKTAVLPTTDLYFLNSCRPWLSRWWRRGPVQRLGANCFACGDRLLLIRRDEPAVIERAITWPGEVIYLIDDDIDGAAQSPGLPTGYRERLARFAAGDFDRLLRRADRIVVSSDVLTERLAGDPRVRERPMRLDPCWPHPIAGQDHFTARSEDARLDVVHLGTASHREGLVRATPAVLAMLDRFAMARFTFIGTPGSHPVLEAHSRVRRIAPMGWRRYQRWLPRQRFHLALYPLAPMAFDHARSANKLIEHGVLGAVGVYPRDWAPAARLGQGAILAPSDPADWEASLFASVAERRDLAGRAAHAAAALARLNDPERQRRFWRSMLGAVPVA